MNQWLVFEKVAKSESGAEYIARVFYSPRGEDPYQVRLFKYLPGVNFFPSEIAGQVYGALDRRDAERHVKELLEHVVNERL